MQLLLNQVINILKWPVAFLSVIIFVPACYRLWRVMEYMYDYPSPYLMLLYGLGVYVILWLVWFKHSVMGQWFSTLEHELTHAIFAILSLNRVTGLNATGHSGGVMHYQGYGNWIITLSPYFVPTLSLLVLLVLSLAKPMYFPYLMFLMGMSIAYHLLSTWKETHYHQSDLQESGWIFVWLFLPTANILMLLIVLTALPNDALSATRSLDYIWQDIAEVWGQYKNKNFALE
jgi:hypothetical protein